MDTLSFDRWTVAISRRPTRRGTLRLLAGGLLGGLLARSGASPAYAQQPDCPDCVAVDPPIGDIVDGGAECPDCILVDPPIGDILDEVATCDAGLTNCGGVCVDLSSDEFNCGACGYGCGSVPCFGGICDTGAIVQNDSPPIGKVIDEVTTCAAGLTMCPSGCSNISSDPNNCGICGYVCSTGDICQGGLCTVAQCPDGQVKCDVFCTSLAADVRNCGTCGNSCAEGLVCCSGVCVDISSDPNNCSACGRRCFTPMIGDPTCSNYSCA